MPRIHWLFPAALMLFLSIAPGADAAEWTRNEARDKIVWNYGAVQPIIGKDDSLSYAIELPPDLANATLLAPFAPIIELILAEKNAHAALAPHNGSESLCAISLENPTEDLLKAAAEFKNLRTLRIVGPADEVLTSLDALTPAKDLQRLGIEGDTFTKGSAETPVESAETVAKLRKLLSDQETFQNEDSLDCYSLERGIRLTAGDFTVEILFCAECKFIEFHEINPGAGLIPKPGDSVRYTHSLSDTPPAEMMSIVDHLLAE